MKKIILSLTALTFSLLGAAQTVTFYYTDSVKTYTVPACVDSITITARGGQGGYSNFSGGIAGGLGADITGTFAVKPGQVLEILAGGMGQVLTLLPSGNYLNGGGGGGSFVWVQSDSALLIAAGGGGGGNSCAHTAGGPGLNTLGGTGLGGTSACGGSCDNGNGVGGGGAGWLGNGAPSGKTPCNLCAPATTPLLGGIGGVGCAPITPYFGGTGGFGGGGAGDGNCGGGGGGGGYTGGNGGGNTLVGSCSASGSTGGTSYNIGANQTNIGGADTGQGRVIFVLHTGGGAPSSITGPATVCANSTAEYSCATVVGATTYTWSFPTGTVITSGQGKDSVYVTFGTTSGTVKVIDNAGCPDDSAMITVTVNPLPVVTLSAVKDTICVTINKDSLIGSPKGGKYAGANVTGASFNPNAAGVGVHSVSYSFTDTITGCSDTTTLQIVVNACTGINEVNALDNAIKFYPDPFSMSINLDVNITGQVILNIYNVTGENVGTWTLKAGLNTINTSGLPAGIYLLRAKTQFGELSKKLTKVQ